MISEKPTVVVLLSTYNGAKFVVEQVKSILAQSGVNVLLRIRDDGSKDDTLSLLSPFAQQENVTIVQGKNVGWKKSFTHLMVTAPLIENAYYAFSDQDDLWHEEKLITAVEMLAKQSGPTVYHGNVAIMDGDLNFLGNRFGTDFHPTAHFPESFLDGFGVGATMVFNAEILALVQQYEPKQATNHDALVMALGNMFGTVVYDSDAHISYRRHAGTATGFGGDASAIKPTLLDRYRRYQRGPKHQFSIRAQELLTGYETQMSSAQRKVLMDIATYQTNFAAKLRLILDPRFKATGTRKTLQIKYRVLCNTL